MNRSAKSPDETRRRLLAAGLNVFGATSFGTAKLEDIASAAGLTRGAISWHFKNKLALYREILIDFSTEKFNAVCGIYNSGAPPLKILEMVIDYHLSCLDDFHLIVSALSASYLEKPEGLEDILNFIDNEFNNYFLSHSALISRGISEGVFRSDLDPDFHSRAFYTYLWGVFLNRKRLYGSFDHETMRVKCRGEILLSYLPHEHLHEKAPAE